MERGEWRPTEVQQWNIIFGPTDWTDWTDWAQCLPVLEFSNQILIGSRSLWGGDQCRGEERREEGGGEGGKSVGSLGKRLKMRDNFV